MTNTNKMELPVIRKKYISPATIVGATILVLLIAFFGRVALWENHYYSSKEGSERDVPETANEVASEQETYDETEPTETEVAEYIVAPDKPRYFSIPSIGIYNSRIKEIGVNANGEMGTPYNIYDTGWYVDSSLPGTKGTSIINAHGGNLGNGIFRNLPNIQVGAEIKVEMGDGRVYTYKVVDKTTKELGEDANNYMPEAFVSPVAGQGSLTLITCTGDWWLNSNTYSQRLFVRATLQ